MLIRSIIILTLCLFGCTQTTTKPINLTLLVDCSTSVMEASHLVETDIFEAANWWGEYAMRNSGGKFEILTIGKAIDDVTLLFSRECPISFQAPLYKSKKEWFTDFQRDLRRLTNNLPQNRGSAIIEAIFRASQRLSESDGEKILLIYTDLREVNGYFNFELSIPNKKVVIHWVKKHNLTPRLTDVRVLVAGFQPYPPNSTTRRITPKQYGELRTLWLLLFEGWGAQAKLTESLNIEYLKGDDISGA